ncbi:MAG: hypothetical protein DME57_09160 [Verrucomicrobia bacterium]|nr:MAG: hypothetical protein DME57_09160 [Verrucomicrobiota bacterium]
MGFVHETKGAIVEVAQAGLGGFVAREFYQIAALQEVRETLLLLGGEDVRVLKFDEEFFGGALWRVKAESFLEIHAQRVRYFTAEDARILDVRQGGVQTLAGADVRRCGRNDQLVNATLLPTSECPNGGREGYQGG